MEEVKHAEIVNYGLLEVGKAFGQNMEPCITQKEIKA